MKIIIDLDSTLTDLFPPWLAWYNETYQDNFTVSQCLSYWIQDCVKPECGLHIYDLFKDFDLSTLQPIPGGIESVQKLQDAGHDIIISSAYFSRYAEVMLTGKHKWTRKWLPFIPERNLMLGGRKDLFCADALIDDSPTNIRDFRKNNPTSFIAALGYPYNLEVAELMDVRAENWDQILKGFGEWVSSQHFSGHSSISGRVETC